MNWEKAVPGKVIQLQLSSGTSRVTSIRDSRIFSAPTARSLGGIASPSFSRTRVFHVPKLLERWNSGWRTLFAALGSFSDEDLSRMVTIRGEKFQAHEALHRLLAHTSYHVGQIVYLAKAFRGAEWNSLSIPPGKSEEYNRNPTRERPPK